MALLPSLNPFLSVALPALSYANVQRGSLTQTLLQSSQLSSSSGQTVFTLLQFTAGAAEDATYHEECRSQDVPADPPVVARSKADHVLDVVTEAASTVDPRDSYRLKQHGDQDGVPSSVTVEEMEEVKSTLGHS